MAVSVRLASEEEDKDEYIDGGEIELCCSDLGLLVLENGKFGVQ